MGRYVCREIRWTDHDLSLLSKGKAFSAKYMAIIIWINGRYFALTEFYTLFYENVIMCPKFELDSYILCNSIILYFILHYLSISRFFSSLVFKTSISSFFALSLVITS